MDTVLEYEPWLWKSRRVAEHSADEFTVETGATAVAQRGTPLRAAQSYVVYAINNRLAALGAQTMLDWPDGNYQLVTRPNNLLGALWFQFASSISGQKSYRACEVCGRAMEMSPDVNRADRRYCSDACRSRALRRRQKTSRGDAGMRERNCGRSPRQQDPIWPPSRNGSGRVKECRRARRGRRGRAQSTSGPTAPGVPPIVPATRPTASGSARRSSASPRTKSPRS